MIRRVVIPLILAYALASGCSGSSSGSSSASAVSSKETVRTAQTLPARGTVKLPDGRVYTVAAPGQVLRLDDVTLNINGMDWMSTATLDGNFPPGTKYVATAAITIGNTTSDPQTVGPTQIWLLSGSTPFLANPGGIVNKQVPAGKTRDGKVSFYLPRKQVGGLLLYRFADSTAIAEAKHVGVARYRKG
ncbi:MAG TPA: hypothetical protein VM785_13200 [Gaiellales bacterium]|nr:hypothetical protein [Gaiellales bacterium]